MRTTARSAILLAMTLGACGTRHLAPAGAAGPGGAGGSVRADGAAGDAAGTAGTDTDAKLTIDPSLALTRVVGVLWQQQRPDPALLQMAASGAIQTEADLANVVRAMLADARASVGIEAFFRSWLDLKNVAAFAPDPVLYPEGTPALLADMVSETTTFGVQVTLQPGATYQTLMTAPFSFLNTSLANLYGVTAAPGADGAFVRTALPLGVRAGLVTQPALQRLGSYSFRTAPSLRGTYLGKRILCEPIPAPPPNENLDPIAPGTTTRAALATEDSSPSCAPCHSLIDPLGLAFEGFDVLGRARTTENGAPVDTSNLEVTISERGGNHTMSKIDGPVDLAKLLATNAAAERCYAQQWLTFALGRDLTDEEQPFVDKAFAAFASSGFDLQTIIVAVLTNDLFLAPP